MMQKIRLKRSDRDDLVFTGTLLASVDDQYRNESNFSWLKLSLYQTSSKAYILGVTLHRYSSTGLKNLCSAVAFTSIEDIRDFLCRDECRDISELLDILLKQATKTKKALKKATFPVLKQRVEHREKRDISGFATAS